MAEVQVADLGGATVDAIDVGVPGYLHPKFFKTPQETKKLFEDLRDFKFRNDDVFLCTFPKTGTHWLYELISMALAKSSSRITTNKTQTMMEIFNADELNQVPSPRVINTHHRYEFLPVKSLREKQIKTVLSMRNPKDTAISYYNHMCGVKAYKYNGKWNDWLPVYIEGKFEFGKHSTWLKEWENGIKQGVGFPLHIVYFEDLKTNGEAEFKKLLDFLGIDIPQKLQSDIVNNCGFDSMAPTKYQGEVRNKFFKEGFNIFRKGEVGDWKQWFTADQNKLFDQVWESEMKDSMFKFRYE